MWETEGIAGQSYDPTTRVANLTLATLKPFAIIQPRALDFPYLNWSVTPTGPNNARFSVTGSRFEVVFEIVGGKCRFVKIATLGHFFLSFHTIFNDSTIFRLVQPSDPVLDPIFKKLMDPGLLLTRMARAGINLMPTDDDAKFCRKPLKTVLAATVRTLSVPLILWICILHCIPTCIQDLEPFLHKHLSMISGIFEVKGSNWNSSSEPGQCLFMCRLAKDSMALSEVPVATVEDAAPVEEPKPVESEEEDGEDGADEMGADEIEEEYIANEKASPEWIQVLATSEQFQLTIHNPDEVLIILGILAS